MNRIAIIIPAILLCFALVTPVAAQIDLNLDYPGFFGIDLATEEGQHLTNIIAWFYAFVVTISGLAAFAVIVYGGVRWMTSAGNPTVAADAKDRIKSALLGLLLVLSSFIILQTINPDLGSLNIRGLPEIPRQEVKPQGDRQPLTANGAVGSVRISPEEDLVLQWNFPNAQNNKCVAYSSDDSWTGTKTASPTQPENRGLQKVGDYTFTLSCIVERAEQFSSVFVFVQEGEATDQPPPAITLFTVNGSPGPSYVISETNELKFEWDSANATFCIGEDKLSFRGSETSTSGDTTLFFPIGTRQASYTIQCINEGNGKSAKETITVELDQ